MATNTDTRRRVKLYQLDDDGKWEDRGTGEVACLFVEVCAKCWRRMIAYVGVCGVPLLTPTCVYTITVPHLLSL